jgi:hypothetical protein
MRTRKNSNKVGEFREFDEEQDAPRIKMRENASNLGSTGSDEARVAGRESPCGFLGKWPSGGIGHAAQRFKKTHRLGITQ